MSGLQKVVLASAAKISGQMFQAGTEVEIGSDIAAQLAQLGAIADHLADPGSSDRMFSQAEVDAIVDASLGAARVAWLSDLDRIKTEAEGLRADLAAAHRQLTAIAATGEQNPRGDEAAPAKAARQKG
jgi:multidrug resistance efflux pump